MPHAVPNPGVINLIFFPSFIVCHPSDFSPQNLFYSGGELFLRLNLGHLS